MLGAPLADALLDIQDTTMAEQGVPVTLTVNGREVRTSVPPYLLLVDFLRDTLGLTGTKVGCETGQCGACTILVDGISAKSCAMLAAQADGHQVTTVEGMAQGSAMTPLQAAFWDKHAVQCGYCTPGLLASMTDLLQRNPDPDTAEIRRWMDGNICRCGVYQNVVRAVRQVAEQAPGGGGE